MVLPAPCLLIQLSLITSTWRDSQGSHLRLAQPLFPLAHSDASDSLLALLPMIPQGWL